MGFKKGGEFKFTIIDAYDKILEEKDNQYVCIRKIDWGNKPEGQIDIRKYYADKNGQEKMGKGISFFSEKGVNELAKVLVEDGYGETKDILTGLKLRPDFQHALNVTMGKESEFYDDAVGDTEVYYVPGENLFDYEEE